MKDWMPIVGAVLVLAIAGGVVWNFTRGNGGSVLKPTPAEEAVISLSPDQYPKVSLVFTADAHYVNVEFSNLHVDQLEYNLIYDATVKKNKVQTGVNAVAQVGGKSTFSQRQLLGSESSGKFTYHENVENAVMELTLRDAAGRSVFTATYPFEVSAGDTVELVASE
jgi:hypothetical protein